MAAVADSGGRGVTLREFVAWHRGEKELAAGAVVLTFDDGYADFATLAYPELKSRGWSATVFLPAGKVGGTDDWEGGSRSLMDWPTVAALAREGIEFGAHGVTHANLTALSPTAACQEIAAAKRMIEDKVGGPVTTFAAPFGKTTPTLQAVIRDEYRAAAGTMLAQASRRSNLYDLPRIEMWYYRDAGRWRAYLEGRGQAYYLGRKALRALRFIALPG
jgi:peptidoglycan/xylan/chitin deacetylase (PgdA/CDA1 family)